MPSLDLPVMPQPSLRHLAKMNDTKAVRDVFPPDGCAIFIVSRALFMSLFCPSRRVKPVFWFCWTNVYDIGPIFQNTNTILYCFVFAIFLKSIFVFCCIKNALFFVNLWRSKLEICVCMWMLSCLLPGENNILYQTRISSFSPCTLL